MAPSFPSHITALLGGILFFVPSGNNSTPLSNNVNCLEPIKALLNDKKTDNVSYLELIEASFNDKKDNNVGCLELRKAPLDDKKSFKDLERDVDYFITQFL